LTSPEVILLHKKQKLQAQIQTVLFCFHREPDFSAVHPGVRILVKCDDNLWHRAVVLTSSSKTKCEVKLESSGRTTEVDLHCILPLGMFDILPKFSKDSAFFPCKIEMSFAEI
jgi:hypothetical protein